jgi:AAA domain-containing protein
VTQLIWNADELYRAELPPAKFIIKGLLPQGETILGGRPTTKKSVILLNIGIDVAGGNRALGELEVDSGAVLYLALEDTERRLHDRLHKMCGNVTPPTQLQIATKWSKGQPGVKLIKQWVEKERNPRLVIIDTMAKFRSRRIKEGNPYQDDYDDYSAIKEVADDAGIGAIINTHERKGGAEDMIESISGTTGQTGAADTTMVLRRKRGSLNGKLFVVGRDVEDCTARLSLDPVTLRWSLDGDVESGHGEWGDGEQTPKRLHMDRTGDFLTWARSRMNGEVEMRLPNQDLVRAETGFSQRELRAVYQGLRDGGQLITKAVRRETGLSNDFFLRNGEW